RPLRILHPQLVRRPPPAVGAALKPTAGPTHANSICVFSGHNDDPGAPLDGSGPNGPGGVCQSYGQDVKLGLVDPREFAVIHHTDCGMLTFSNSDIRSMLKRDTGSDAAEQIDFLPFSDLEASVTEDVKRIREHLLIPKDVSVRGFIYDVKSGRLN